MASSEFIKRAGTMVEFTPEQALELKRCAEDPVYFINNYCYIQNQLLGRMKFKLRPYQERIVRSLHKNRFNILMIGRQCGKTETTAAYSFWFACFKDDKNVLVASNKQKGATDIMNRIKFMYENTPDFLRPGVTSYNRGSVEFDNGSKIWSEATTETTGRGRSVALFICDELAHVKRRIQEEMWASILPTLSTGGSCVVMSTPNGDSDLFAQLWRQANSDLKSTEEELNMGEEPFVPIEVGIEEIPGRDEKWQRMMRAKLGDVKFEQEYLCIQHSSDPLLVSSRILTVLKGRPPLFIDKGFSFWKEPTFDKTYIIGVDVAEGLEKDFSTIEVFELDTLEQVAEFRNNKIKEEKLFEAIKWILQKLLSYRDAKTGRFPMIQWSFENNSVGAVIGALYNNDEKFPEQPELVNAKSEKFGMRTTNKAKLEACRYMKNLLEKAKGGYVLNSEKLIFELKNYIQRGASYAAKDGCTDDLVSACLIVTRIIKQISEYDPETFNKIYKSEGDFYDETTSEFDDPMPFVF
jgi:hypothetical protein